MARAHAHELQSARMDVLTGLPLRGLFNDEATRRLTALQPGQALGLLYVDLDGFKALNDSQGHEAGDRALAATGALLRQLLRPEDLAARLGGDEFAVALVAPQAALRHSCVQVAQRLVAGLPEAAPGLACSVGIAIALPGEPLAAVLARADKAMLTAKRSGKGNVQMG
jgi:diguanylate cyclase (GGDEF)-like protein